MNERPLASMPVTMRRTGGRGVDMEPSPLFREQARRILEGLEFERVTGRVVEEEGGLLADFAAKADTRLDHEARVAAAQARRELVPVFPLQHHAEVRHGHVLAVHFVEVECAAGRVEMRDQL